MSLQPTLSIVTVTYRDAAGLMTTIESLKPLLENGTDISWEHIIIDSSPEDTRPAKEKLPMSWPLVYVPEKPAGIYAAQNSGLSRAKGRYVWFLNGGDRLKSAQVLNKVLQELESNSETSAAFSAADLMRDGKYMYTQEPKETWEANIVGMNRICHQAVLYRRSEFQKLGNFSTEFKIASDYDHLYRSFVSGAKAVFLSDVLVEYDMSGTSQTYVASFSEFWQVQKQHSKELPFWMRVVNPVVWGSEFGRVSIIKVLAASPLSGVLRPLWIKLKRRGR